MINNRINTVVYDIETLKSCFTYTDINIKTEKVNQFVIHKDKFELLEFVEYLKTLKGGIGFNNVNFDYPILHYLMKYISSWNMYSSTEIIESLYDKAQEIISLQDDKDKFYKTVVVRQKDMYYPQLDLFKLWHYNNKARSTSLKALEISMNYPNVMEMPISHTKDDITLDEIPSILEYNLNDVLATYEFFKKSKGKIKLRSDFKKKYNLPCDNWSDSKIGEQLVLSLYCKESNRDYWEVKKQRTYRPSINLKECVPNNVKFNTDTFKELLDYFNNKTITSTKGAIEKSIVYKNCKYDYGTGGIHGTTEKGIYKSDDKYIIKSCDVALMWRK